MGGNKSLVSVAKMCAAGEQDGERGRGERTRCPWRQRAYDCTSLVYILHPPPTKESGVRREDGTIAYHEVYTSWYNMMWRNGYDDDDGHYYHPSIGERNLGTCALAVKGLFFLPLMVCTPFGSAMRRVYEVVQTVPLNTLVVVHPFFLSHTSPLIFSVLIVQLASRFLSLFITLPYVLLTSHSI